MQFEESRWQKMNTNQRESWLLSAGIAPDAAYFFRDADWQELPVPIAEKLIAGEAHGGTDTE